MTRAATNTQAAVTANGSLTLKPYIAHLQHKKERILQTGWRNGDWSLPPYPVPALGQSTEWIFVRTSSTKGEQVVPPRRSEAEIYTLLPIFDGTEAFSRLPWCLLLSLEYGIVTERHCAFTHRSDASAQGKQKHNKSQDNHNKHGIDHECSTWTAFTRIS